MNISALALRRPVTTLMVFICCVVVGLIGAKRLPLEYFPEVQFPGIFINVPYQASSSAEVERLITRPIEEVMATISGIQKMNSNTTNEGANIQVFFGWDANAIVKGIEAREKIDAIRTQLPRDLERINVFTGRTTDQPIMEMRISSETRDLSRAYDLLDRKLRRVIEQVPGVSKVDLQGVQPMQIEIQLLPERVAAHAISLNDLARTLAKYNFSTSAGLISDGEQRIRVKPVGEWKSIEDIAVIPVNNRGLRLSDIADIRYEQSLREEGRHINLKDAIGLSIQKEAGSNMVDVAKLVMATVDKIGASADFKGINLFMLNNQAEGVIKSLNDIVNSGIVGFILSVLVLYAFLRNWALTIIVSMAVPFSLCITLAYMYFAGVTLNVLSMMGLMLAIGMLVDNAVVVSESIFKESPEKYASYQERILAGVKHVGLAITTGTITTIIVFLPNIIGEKVDITVFLSHVATTITVSLVASLFIALTIIPLLLSRIKLQNDSNDAPWLQKLTQWYVRRLQWMLDHPVWAGIIAVALLASVAIPGAFVKQDMFEQNQTDRLNLNYNIDGRYTVERIETAIIPIEKWMLENKDRLDIDTVYSYFTSEFAFSFVLLNKERKTQLSTEEIIKTIEDEMPKLAIGKPGFRWERFGGGESLRVQLSGDSTERLVELAAELTQLLRNVKGFRDVRSEANTGDWEVQVRIDRTRAHNLGLNPEQIANAVAVAMRGQQLRTLRDSNGETRIKLSFSQNERATLRDLESLPLMGANQARIPLTAVADISVNRSLQQINREDRLTSIAVSAEPDGIDSEEARKRIEPMLEKLQMPPGYHAGFGGGWDRENETGRVFMQNMLLAIMMIYVVMAMLFESLLFPSAVIFSIFYAIVGVFWTFLALNTSLSIMAFIGILVLMGVVVNNGIVLIDHINQSRLAGVNRELAVLNAGRERLRPILMTTATTVLGLIPLCFGSTTIGGDNDSPPYYPMARAVAGGLIFSTLVSLLVLPSIYILLDNLRIWQQRVLQEAKWRARGEYKTMKALAVEQQPAATEQSGNNESTPSG